MMRDLLRSSVLVAVFFLFGVEPAVHAADATSISIKRTNNKSPTFYVHDADVGYYMNYTGFTYTNEDRSQGKRFFRGQIGPKVLEMIGAAEQYIIMSVFLFDSFYAAPDVPTRDIVQTLSDALLRKRSENPDIRIAIILDPSHKAYGRRVSPVERRFRENGIDVFYSDLLSGLKKASLVGTREGLGHVNRVIDTLTGRTWGSMLSGVFSRAKLPVKFDGDTMSLENAYNAVLLKANHRKLLVTDTRDGSCEALVSSANPHNASAFHINSAVSVKGAMAAYVFNVLRADMMQSARLGRNFTHWHNGADRAYRKRFFTDRFPPLAIETTPTEGAARPRVEVSFVTESEIPVAVIDALEHVEPGDDVRIQMFYLSFEPVLQAILGASRRVKQPVRLLLDANKDSFNKEKDGTPNRQAARYLLRRAAQTGGKLAVRWYSTHGEQNHAKTMSITNPEKQKYLLTTGSCNWTGRNMDGVNMEANVFVAGSARTVGAFNECFDLFWSNRDGNEYSVDYSAFADETAPDHKWRRGEKPFYYSTF